MSYFYNDENEFTSSMYFERVLIEDNQEKAISLNIYINYINSLDMKLKHNISAINNKLGYEFKTKHWDKESLERYNKNLKYIKELAETGKHGHPFITRQRKFRLMTLI